MKNSIIKILLGYALMIGFNCCAQKTDNGVEETLKDFYSSIHYLWVNTNDPAELLFKLDSVNQLYCTIDLRNEIKQSYERNGLDFDIFTNNYGFDEESINTLSITKEPTKDNIYLISYFTNTYDPSNKRVTERVMVTLEVVKINGNYKIKEVW